MEGKLKELVWPSMRCYFDICLEKQNKTTRRLRIIGVETFIKLKPQETNFEATWSVFFYYYRCKKAY